MTNNISTGVAEYISERCAIIASENPTSHVRIVAVVPNRTARLGNSAIKFLPIIIPGATVDSRQISVHIIDQYWFGKIYD